MEEGVNIGWPGKLEFTGLTHIAPNLMWHSVCFINRESGRIDTWAEAKKGIVTDGERKKELFIVSNYKLCSVLSTHQLTENQELESVWELGVVLKNEQG